MTGQTDSALELPDTQTRPAQNGLRFTRHDQSFVSQGTRCGAWLYLPEGVVRPPVVVMAHGFGGQRWMRLPAYAERFAQRGLAVFVFDYRGFNDSQGQPRNYVNPTRHIKDWTAAVAHVRTLEMVDTRRIALWGTSFSAGHVMVIAARDPDMSAIVLQVPFTDGATTALNYSLPFQLKCIYHGLRDLLAAFFTGKRHHVLIAGKPDGAFGMMSTPDAFDGMLKVMGVTDASEYEQHNFCPADIAFTLTFYRPVRHAKKITCPALVIGAEKDSLFPPDGPRKAAKKMNNATYISLPMTHFEPYVGEPFDQLVVKMADFLQAHLK
ncbi:MAG: alpha/beta fold hydrolase [Desulfobacteraceae bacterium]|nr:alpha/beta fold hydrolase [Desulfobacteraceae bacterium]